jgi:ABC-type Na+ efflux pump permease subunit
MNTIKTFWSNLREAFSPEENPFLAQERWGRRRGGRMPLWDALRLILLLVAPLVLVVALMLSREGGQLGMWLASLVSVIHIPLILLAVAFHCGRVFSREEQQGTLDLLLMVPTRRPWLVWHKLAGPILTGLRVAAYGLPLYLLSLLLGGVSLWTLLMLAVVCFLAALPVAGPWTFTLLYPGERGETTSRRMPSLTETFWLTCFALLGVFILGCVVVGGLGAVEQAQQGAAQVMNPIYQQSSAYGSDMVAVPSEPASVYAEKLPLTVFVGLAAALGRSHPFFHGRLWLLPPVLLLVLGMVLNRVLAAAARMHVASAGEGRLRQWRTALSVGVTAGWLLLVLGYAWRPIEKGAIAYLSAPMPSLASSVREVPVVPENLIVRFNLDNVRIQTAAMKDDSNRLQVQREISEERIMRQRLLEGINVRELHHKIQSLPHNRRLRFILEQALLEAVNAQEVRRHAMTGLLLMLFTLTAVVGSLLLIVSGPWREHLEALHRRGAGSKVLFRELLKRGGLVLAAPAAFFGLVCLCGGFGPWQVPLANWAQYGLLTAATLLLCGAFGLWWTLAEAGDPSGRSARRLMALFLAAVLLWPVGALLTKSPLAHTTALTSPFVSFALQYGPANTGLQKWYGWSPFPQPQVQQMWRPTPQPQVQQMWQQTTEEPTAPPVAPWWMALVLQGALAGLFLRVAGQLARRAPRVADVEDLGAAEEPGWAQRQWERFLGCLPGWLDNPVALKEWRLMVRQADLVVIGMLVLSIGVALAYAALRWPDQMPAVWQTDLFEKLTHSDGSEAFPSHPWRSLPHFFSSSLSTGRPQSFTPSPSNQGGEGHFPWCNALLLYLPFIAGLLFLLGPVSLGGAMAKEREGGTWPFVLMTPLSDGAIMRGKLLGLMASSLALGGMALPMLLLLAAGSSLELWGEAAWAPWFLLGIGITWFASLAFVGSAAGLYAACRCRSASTAQLSGLFWTFLVSLMRLCLLPLLSGGPGWWLVWHGFSLLVEGVAAAGFYEAARSHCHRIRAGDIQFEEVEVRAVEEEG